ncbi:tRNA-dihydrouridine synthase, partial [bacterium]|nr:tRNA-dihydrouridine synthase [bacterium]
PAVLGEAARRVAELEPDVIDLNFGCPVKKVVRRGAGAGFLEDLGRLSAAVREVVKASSIPVTVKLRSGPASDRINAVEAARRSEDAGAAAVVLHARTTSQFFRGRADWKVIAEVKQAIRIPVIGNGDVARPEDAQRLWDETGCDGIMIGRGALGHPWMFAACAAALQQCPYYPPNAEEKWAVIAEHYQMMLADKGDKVGLLEMRKHLGWYSKGLPGAVQYRAQVVRLNDPQDVLTTSKEFFLKSKLAEAGSD